MIKKLLFAVILLTGLYFISPRFLLARSVECYTQFGPCPSSVAGKLSALTHLPLLRPLPSAKVKQLLAEFPQVRSVALFRRLPSTLIVSVDLRRPLGLVLGSQSPESYGLVDEDGTVFSVSSGPLELPVLKLSGPVDLNTQLTPSHTSALTAMQRLSQLGFGIPTGNLHATTLTAHMQNGLEIVINTDHSWSLWYSPLQLILDRSKISSKFPKKIDMRFTNPVLTY